MKLEDFLGIFSHICVLTGACPDFLDWGGPTRAMTYTGGYESSEPLVQIIAFIFDYSHVLRIQDNQAIGSTN